MSDDPKTIQARPGSVMDTLVGDASEAPSAPPAIPPPRYILGHEIARGGMGRVVEATDTLLGRVVALKEALATDKEALDRFARETRITARLEHPSIVPVHDGGVGSNGMPYYVMRLVGGRALEQLVAAASTLNDRLRLIPHIVATAQAIAHAHERSIVHRDIKPSNILVGELGETIVIDWGLAKVIGETDEPSEVHGIPVARANDLDTIQTRAGIVFGTPGFMAPEQLRGGPVDPRWDVYALGATLYHLLSRKPPHYAKTADEMMAAAIKAPPTPIGDLVTGVPSELSTIIDKSLAFDPDARYQDARAVAEELQAFLTGQLVAAHTYSRRERIARFVRRHRVELFVAGVAILALLVLGTGAFVRIMRERDRADHAARVAEERRQEAERSSEDLRLSQARVLASSNPTQAIALLRPLAEKRWRDVRTIAAQAHATGVAWSLPGARQTRSLEMSHDGQRVLSASDEGVVRLYDLVARTQRTVIDAKGPATAAFADGDKRIVLWSPQVISIVEIATGAHREIHTATKIVDLSVADTIAYWTDTDGAVWQLGLAGDHPMRIPLDESIRRVVPSPDGKWLALAGEMHLLLLDRSSPGAEAREVTIGRASTIDWSATGSHLAVLYGEIAIVVQMEPEPLIIHRNTVGQRSFVLASGERMFTVGPTGVGIVAGSVRGNRKQLAQAIGLEEARGDSVIAAGEEMIAVLRDSGDHVLIPPGGRFGMVRASPRSPYVIATLDDRLLVWNLDEIEPRIVATNIATSHFVTSNDVLTTSLEGPTQWIDLATSRSRELALGQVVATSASPDGRAGAALDLGHQLTLLEAGQPPVTLAGPVDHAGFASDDVLVLATDDGAIDRYSLALHQRTPLVPARSKLVSLAWSQGSPAWVAAQFADNSLWRANLATGVTRTVIVPRSPTSNVRLTPRGDVMFATGTELFRWTGEGPPLHHATLPRAVTTLATAPDVLVAIADDGALFVIDATTSDRVTDTKELLGRNLAAMSAQTGIIATIDRGAIVLVDPHTPQRWQLAAATTGMFTDLEISSDGKRVLARSGPSALVWTLDLPASGAATAAWLDKMTNATSGNRRERPRLALGLLQP